MSQKHEFWKIFFSLIGIAIGLGILFFGILVGYYLWQLRYGSSETITQLSNQYVDKFTAVSNEKAPLSFENPQTLISPKNPTRGADTAPVTIIAFMDFECPYSQESYPILTEVLDQFGPAVRFVFKHLPLTTIHPNALNASLASACAHEQQQFWPYEDALFNSAPLSDDLFYAIAQSSGLNLTSFDSCFTTKKYKNTIDEDLQDALTVGVRGTPTFIIGNEVIEGVPSEEEWSTLILKHLNR